MSRTCWWCSLTKPGLRMSPCALTSLMMANQVTGLLQYLWQLHALSSNRVPTMPMRRSPYGGCACKNCRHTGTLWLSWGAPLQWFHVLSSWVGKFSMYLPLLLPQSACFLRVVILWPKNGPDYPAIILRNSCTCTRFGWKWGSGRPSRNSLGVVPTCRPHACTHTQTHTHTQKTLLVVFPVSSLWQTINTKKETTCTSETLSPFSTNIWTPPYDQNCIIIHPYQHRCMSGFHSFCPLNCILSFRDPNFFEHVHLEWTYSQVLSRVYCSSGVGLRLLVRLEKSLITKDPHRYVWSETIHVFVWIWWGGPREDSSKSRCFLRIFTLWQLWQNPTPTPCPGSWYFLSFLTHRDMFLTHKKTGWKSGSYLYPYR